MQQVRNHRDIGVGFSHSIKLCYQGPPRGGSQQDPKTKKDSMNTIYKYTHKYTHSVQVERDGGRRRGGILHSAKFLQCKIFSDSASIKVSWKRFSRIVCERRYCNNKVSRVIISAVLGYIVHEKRNAPRKFGTIE